MRKLSVILLTSTLVLLLVPLLAVAYRSGPPAGHTGAPAVGGRTCVVCHVFGGPNTGPGNLTISTPANTYAPGSVIPVTVALGAPLQNANVNGFQMAGYATGNNTALAGWTSIDANATQVISDHIEHTQAGSTSRASWNAYFRTPGASVPGFTLYAAGNDADGNGFSSNDRIYTANLPLTAGTVNLSMRSVPVRGAGVTFDLNAPGDAGRSYVLAASFSNAGFKVGGKTIPLFPDSLLLITVANVLPSVFQGYTGILDGSGRATATLAVPSIPALQGLTLHHAFVVLNPSQPAGIGTISNPLPVTIT